MVLTTNYSIYKPGNSAALNDSYFRFKLQLLALIFIFCGKQNELVVVKTFELQIQGILDYNYFNWFEFRKCLQVLMFSLN